jgi:hypothetical protein
MAIYSGDMYVDKKEQLDKIEDFCLANEVIRAVYDLKGVSSGFLAITDKRLIFYDKEFFKKQKAVISLPYNRIAQVASDDDKGVLIKRGFFISDKLYVFPQGLEPKVFEFRGGDKAHRAHYLIMEYLLARA